VATKKTSAKKRATKKTTDPSVTAVDAALRLAKDLGWRHVTLADVAEEAKLPIAELYAVHRSKESIVTAFVAGVDRAVLAADLSDLAGEPARERLFDVLMRRFDALAPHRQAIASIARDTIGDPIASICGGCRLATSMRWMLEAAGIPASGVEGRLKVKVLAVLWLAALRIWLRDDSADNARTMAFLDKRLRRLDSIIGRCRGSSRSSVPEAA